MRVKVQAIKRGNYIQATPPGIIRCDPDGVDEAKFPIVEHTSVPDMVRLKLIEDPGDLSALERQPAVAIDVTGINADRFNLHRDATADVTTIAPTETRGNVNFPPSQNVDGQAAEGLAVNDPDAAPAPKRGAAKAAAAPEPAAAGAGAAGANTADAGATDGKKSS